MKVWFLPYNKLTCEELLCSKVTIGPDDELTNSKWVDNVIGLALADVFPSSTLISIPCLNLKGYLSWLYSSSSALKKCQKEYKQNRGISAFCLGVTNCMGHLFFVPEVVDKVVSTVFSDVEPSNWFHGMKI